jgi:hypothetical protein
MKSFDLFLCLQNNLYKTAFSKFLVNIKKKKINLSLISTPMNSKHSIEK